MKNLTKISALLLIVVTLFATGCSSSKKGACGCPQKKGFVGY
jgi:predicted component of type VI protein secretion system